MILHDEGKNGRMKLNLFEVCRKQKMYRGFAVYLFSIALLYAAVCTPIYHIVNSNILLAGTVLSLLLDIFMQLLNYLFYWGAFAFVLYAGLRFGIANSLSFLLTYGGAVAFRYTANLLAGYLTKGFPMFGEFIERDLLYFLIDIVMDIVQLLVFLWILSAVKNKYDIAYFKKNGDMIFSYMPFSKPFDFQNPIQRCCLWGALIPSSVYLVSRIIYDCYLGAPTDLIELLWMILSYLSDLVFILIGYFFSVLFLNKLYEKEMDAKARYESSSDSL